MLRSKLIDDLIAAGAENSQPVRDVRVGISWTAVYGKYCGLAKTYGIPFKHGNYTRNMGNLTGMNTLELAEYAQSWNLVEASIGCAAITAMVAPPDNSVNINAREFIIEQGTHAKVVMVGAFPFVDKLKAVAMEMYIMELDSSLLDTKENILPEAAADFIIPECDLLIITGSALINKSLERYLTLARKSKAYTVILGPSTVMSEVFFEYGADMVGGAIVTKPEAIMNKLSQSGGMLESSVCPGEIIFKVMQK